MQINWDDIGLNSQMQDKEGLAAKPRSDVTGYIFRSNNERGAVTGFNLGNFSFNSGTGGTIVLSGGMTIKNSGGTTIIDSTGLNGINTFNFGGTVSTSNTRTTSSTSFTAVPNTSVSIVLSRTSRVLFLGYGNFNNYGANEEQISEYVGLDVGGTLYPDSLNGFGQVFFWGDTSEAGQTTVLSSWSGQSVVNVGAGTTVAQLKYRKGSGDTPAIDARVIDTSLFYLVLGN